MDIMKLGFLNLKQSHLTLWLRKEIDGTRETHNSRPSQFELIRTIFVIVLVKGWIIIFTSQKLLSNVIWWVRLIEWKIEN